MNEIHMFSELAKSKHAFSVLELFYNFKEIDNLDLFILNKDEAVKTLDELGLIKISENTAKVTELGMETFAYFLLR